MIKKGISVSDGLGLAHAYVIYEPEAVVTSELTTDPQEQLNKLEKAILEAEIEIKKSKEMAQSLMDGDDAYIFDAHLAILKDKYFLSDVKELIKLGHYASYAYQQVTKKYIDEIRQAENLYLQERSVDVTDVYMKVMFYLNALSKPALHIDQPVVLVAKDLTPSQTIGLDFNYVKGIVTERGGKTSHAAIIARTLGIPSVAGIRVNAINNNDLLLVDGRYGTVTIDPSEDELVEYAYFLDRIQSKEKRLEPFKKLKTQTLDGHFIKLGANISSHEEINHLKYAEGVGLFRTEYLFMRDSKTPTLEEQIHSYQSVLASNKEDLNIIRTLDIGGDKNLTYLPIKKELNPFLGQRAIRLSLANKNLFKTQLKALLIANKYSNLGIMLPMISTLDEIIEAKEIITKVEEELLDEGYIINQYQLGIMVEVPIAAFGLEDLIGEVDFISIGSNDLIQYLFAADRMNEEVAYLYQPYHPQLLKIIKHVVTVAHKYNKWVGVCGEMAGVKESALLLVGLGVDELSMGYTSILEIREMLSRAQYVELKKLTNKMLKLKSNEEVLLEVRKYLEKISVKKGEKNYEI
ncbi:MAG: phosphoenolpyruvate--protein phosphotransferase [Acholeplasmataceae bacterium]|jgi:phosphotransferase system enzyme I (PtsI)